MSVDEGSRPQSQRVHPGMQAPRNDASAAPRGGARRNSPRPTAPPRLHPLVLPAGPRLRSPSLPSPRLSVLLPSRAPHQQISSLPQLYVAQCGTGTSRGRARVAGDSLLRPPSRPPGPCPPSLAGAFSRLQPPRPPMHPTQTTQTLHAPRGVPNDPGKAARARARRPVERPGGARRAPARGGIAAARPLVLATPRRARRRARGALRPHRRGEASRPFRPSMPRGFLEVASVMAER